MKIDGSILDLVGMRIFNASYTGENADLSKLKHDIVDLIKRSWKFYNDFLDAEDVHELTKLEMYGASEIASNSSDFEINLFYKNIFADNDCLYHLYFNAYRKIVDTWKVFPDELDSFKESIKVFEDKYGEDLTKICLLIGIYFESIDTRYMHIREYAYGNLLEDEKELEEYRQSSHYRYVTNRPPKIDSFAVYSYENMTKDELIDEFVKLHIEHRKILDVIFENE